FVFFQAEDGIRDPLVTGVQTCALPILWRDDRGAPPRALDVVAAADGVAARSGGRPGGPALDARRHGRGGLRLGGARFVRRRAPEIGRASCRAGGQSGGGGAGWVEAERG